MVDDGGGGCVCGAVRDYQALDEEDGLPPEESWLVLAVEEERGAHEPRLALLQDGEARGEQHEQEEERHADGPAMHAVPRCQQHWARDAVGAARCELWRRARSR